MTPNKYDQKFDDIAEKFKNNPTDEERQELNKEFFRNAAELFNEEIAGDITLVDGRKVTIPEI